MNMRELMIADIVYGQCIIDEPVLIELIQAPSVQRLKKLNQFGIPDRYYPFKNFSRFDHSVGVMLCLKKFGAGLEEQIAGLLHDVSHKAFSHLYDWVIGTQANEEYQDSVHVDFISKSELPGILQNHGMNTERVADHDLFGLLERPAPELCADRLDYVLREGPHDAEMVLSGVEAKEGRLVFKDIATAKIIGNLFIKRQRIHWGGFEVVNCYNILSNTLKNALGKGIIDLDDFDEDDESIISKLELSDDPEIVKTLRILHARNFSDFPKSKGTMTKKKFRHMDPLVNIDGGVKKLSEIDTEYAFNLEEARIENEKGVLLLEA